MLRTFLFLCTLSFCLASCNQKKAGTGKLPDANLLHQNMQQLTKVIIYDVFSPPVASRIYSYTSLAAYEALRFEVNKESIVAEMKGFSKMPEPQKGKNYNYLLAATKAFFTVSEKLTFSIDTLKQYQDKVYAQFENGLPEDVYANSLSFGDAVGQAILTRTTVDNYKHTRGLPKFLGSEEEGKWRPTPPDYLDASEPYWFDIKPLLLDSASQISCPKPPPFSKDTGSVFYKSVKEVYDITTNLTEEQRQTARYWDDNPFVMEHSGHLAFGNKKITPVGHWIGITEIACKKKGLGPLETARAYALSSCAMFDVIISCWKSKYEYQHIRPITFINQHIDGAWQPFLQTPPFPEHSSGHSGISAAAATVLTRLFGDNFSFEDTSDLEYIGMKRTFPSFLEAAREASISRVYGGIHYFTGVDAGAIQGSKVASYYIEKLLK